MNQVLYGGVDPSGSARRPSGCALIDQEGRMVESRLCSDEEILVS